MNKPLLVISSLIFLVVGGCKKESNENNLFSSNIELNPSTIKYHTPEGLTYTGYNEEDLLENKSFNKKIIIQFGYPIQIVNDFQTEAVIQYVGNDVLITATGEGLHFELSGAAPDGSIKIYSDYDYQITLNNLNLESTQGGVINLQSKKKGFIHLKANTTNVLKDALHYNNIGEDEDLKSTLFSEGPLIFNGTGTLSVEGNNRHAICSDDYLRFREGNYNITKAASDAIHTNDSLVIDNGNFTVRADSDGLEAKKGNIIINNGVFDIDVLDDGIAASYDEDDAIVPYIIIHNGTFNIKTAEGEGIESKAEMYIHNGNINIEAYDDGINAHTLLIINNGNHIIKSLTNDGIDCNDAIIINGGITQAYGAAIPEGGIDNDNFPFSINGGILIGGGGRNSVPRSSDTEQVVLIFLLKDNQSKQFAIMQSDQLIAAITTPTTISNLLYSDSRITKGQTITLQQDVLIESSSNEWGLHFDGKVSGGTTLYKETLEGRIKILQ